MRVLVFGDSITQGFWDTEGGWLARVRKNFDEMVVGQHLQDYVSFFNLGVDGDATSDVLTRLESETKARLWSGEQYTFIFAVGTNDTIFDKNGNYSEPGDFNQRLTQIIEIAKKYTEKIFFVGLTPVQDVLLQPMPWSKSGKCYSTERMRLFDQTLRNFCEHNNVHYLDIWNEFASRELGGVMYDGIHPNATGHQIIADKVIQALKA